MAGRNVSRHPGSGTRDFAGILPAVCTASGHDALLGPRKPGVPAADAEDLPGHNSYGVVQRHNGNSCEAVRATRQRPEREPGDLMTRGGAGRVGTRHHDVADRRHYA